MAVQDPAPPPARLEKADRMPMSYDDLVALVRRSAAIDTHDHAVDAVTATAQVLASRLRGASLAIGPYLSEAVRVLADAGVVDEGFTLDDFYDRVAALEGRDCLPPEVRRHARAAVRAFRDAAGPELERVLEHLPAAYADLLASAGPEDGAVTLAPPRIPGQRRPVHDDGG